MSNLLIIGLAIYLIGHGVRGLPGLGTSGSLAMIVGGVIVLVSALT